MRSLLDLTEVHAGGLWKSGGEKFVYSLEKPDTCTVTGQRSECCGLLQLLLFVEGTEIGVIKKCVTERMGSVVHPGNWEGFIMIRRRLVLPRKGEQ